MAAIDKTVVAGVETVTLHAHDGMTLPARIDTGAQTSAIHVESVEELSDGRLRVVFQREPLCERIYDAYEEVTIRSSNGTKERRYKVLLDIEIQLRRMEAMFTLASRETQEHPVLIGRNVLAQGFIVDVSANE